MCVSAADGNSGGRLSYYAGLARAAILVGPRLLSVGVFFDREENCTDRNVGAT